MRRKTIAIALITLCALTSSAQASICSQFLARHSRKILVTTTLMSAGLGFKYKPLEFFLVSGDSMLPTLHDKDRVLIQKISGEFAHYDPDDIITFNFTDSEGNHEYVIKRIVGVPGDHVVIDPIKGTWVNGNLKYPIPERYKNWFKANDFVLGPSEYFVQGDNTAVSRDSRTFGTIDGQDIIGSVVKVFHSENAGQGVSVPAYGRNKKN